MATTVVLTNVIKEPPPSTRYLIDFSDGTQHEFADLAELTEWARRPDGDPESVQKICIAYALARSNDLSNVSTVLNKDFTFDLSAPSAIKVSNAVG